MHIYIFRGFRGICEVWLSFVRFVCGVGGFILQEDGAEEIIFQAMATMRDIAMNSSKQIDVGQGSRLQAQKDFLVLSQPTFAWCLVYPHKRAQLLERRIHCLGLLTCYMLHVEICEVSASANGSLLAVLDAESSSHVVRRLPLPNHSPL